MKGGGRRKTAKEKVRVSLRNCGYPEWALKEGEQIGRRRKRREEEMKGQGWKEWQREPKKAFMVLQCMKGVMERVQRAYKQHNIQLFFKAGYSIRNAGICLNDPLDPENKCDMIYECKSEECGQLYVEETERSLCERTHGNDTSVKESDSKSALNQHSNISSHLY